MVCFGSLADFRSRPQPVVAPCSPKLPFTGTAGHERPLDPMTAAGRSPPPGARVGVVVFVSAAYIC